MWRYMTYGPNLSIDIDFNYHTWPARLALALSKLA